PRDGTPMLMEVNPRFWGALQMSILCGINFPYLLYKIARGEKIEPVHTYKVGVMCRALPYDILHFLNNSHRWKMQPSFFKFFHPQIHFDIISAHDSMPALTFFLTCIPHLSNAKMWIRLGLMK
ncbi:MAG: ATP-grasp domain-containing protein, partial [Candidatus Peribacteraceae bacterium]|nr:ATP-grasp domain-containing protein [Candidatus Peribacteraceae bacterium]